MKLLFDQNLSPSLVMRLADLFPDASHVQTIDLDCASDDRVWEHARLTEMIVHTHRFPSAGFARNPLVKAGTQKYR